MNPNDKHWANFTPSFFRSHAARHRLAACRALSVRAIIH